MSENCDAGGGCHWDSATALIWDASWDWVSVDLGFLGWCLFLPDLRGGGEGEKPMLGSSSS